MWRDRQEHKKAGAIVDELRPPRYRRNDIPALLRANKGTGAEYVLGVLEKTRSPLSRKGMLDYLLRIATERPRTYAALLGKALHFQNAKRSEDLRRFGADLEKFLIEALEGWKCPNT
jgi:hypothetical protein